MFRAGPGPEQVDGPKSHLLWACCLPAAHEDPWARAAAGLCGLWQCFSNWVQRGAVDTSGATDVLSGAWASYENLSNLLYSL